MMFHQCLTHLTPMLWKVGPWFMASTYSFMCSHAPHPPTSSWFTQSWTIAPGAPSPCPRAPHWWQNRCQQQQPHYCLWTLWCLQLSQDIQRLFLHDFQGERRCWHLQVYCKLNVCHPCTLLTWLFRTQLCPSARVFHMPWPSTSRHASQDSKHSCRGRRLGLSSSCIFSQQPQNQNINMIQVALEAMDIEQDRREQKHVTGQQITSPIVPSSPQPPTMTSQNNLQFVSMHWYPHCHNISLIHPHHSSIFK